MTFSALAFQRLARARGITMSQWAVACALSHQADETGRVFVNRQQLAEDLGCSVRHMADIITDLEATGLIWRRSFYGYTGPHDYQLLEQPSKGCMVHREHLHCMPQEGLRARCEVLR